MEESLGPLAVSHLLQHTLRSLCSHDTSQWVYAVFWRILPRNFPPPKWDVHGGAYDRSSGNRRNWILVWEDGFCNFAASTNPQIYGNCQIQQFQGLQPEIFFKMSHEVYNYGEGLIGKVAADLSHKWIHKDADEHQEINFLSAWHNSVDSHPRTWEAQFRSGIKTIALVAVREGVVQLGAMQKASEDLSYVVTLRRKFSLIESIPGALLPHPSSSAIPEMWQHHQGNMAPPPMEEIGQYGYESFSQPNQVMMMKVTPSMSSLEALLLKLPSVVPPPLHQGPAYNEYQQYQQQLMATSSRPLEVIGGPAGKVAKEEMEEEIDTRNREGECSSSMTSYHQQQLYYHQDLNITSSRPENGF